MTIHSGFSTPSPWVCRFAPIIPKGGKVLDFACGAGRNSRLLAAAGHAVEAVDRDLAGLAELVAVNGVEVREADLEAGVWPYDQHTFSGIVVTNYLFRPRLPALLAALADPGVLIYETFMIGNERYGKPSNPDFLLQSQELLDWAEKMVCRFWLLRKAMLICRSRPWCSDCVPCAVR